MFGAHNLNDTHEVERVALKPDAIIIHEDWNTTDHSYDADISLLKFEKGKININSVYISPICIWDSIDDSQTLEGVVFGWQRSEYNINRPEDVPKLIKVAIQNNGDCLLKHPSLAVVASSRTFCAGEINGSAICTGYGSGLFVVIDGIYYHKGIFSVGRVELDGSCDTSGEPGVYTNTHKYINWIRQKTQGAYATKGILFYHVLISPN